VGSGRSGTPFEPPIPFQLILHSNGEIEFIYGPNVTNDSTFGGISDNGVVGVSPGTPAVLPASSDFTNPVVTADPTVFEEFLVANSFDLANDRILLTPNPLGGWAVTRQARGAGCAATSSLGAGCEGLTLTGDDPLLGSNWTLTNTGVDPISPVTFTFVGMTSTLVDLTSFGAPGCFCYVDNLVVRYVAAVVAGQSTVTVPIPAVPALAGLQLRAQTLAFSTANAGGFASSDGLEGTVGN